MAERLFFHLSDSLCSFITPQTRRSHGRRASAASAVGTGGGGGGGEGEGEEEEGDEESCQVMMRIPNDKIGRVIGKQGETINSIRQARTRGWGDWVHGFMVVCMYVCIYLLLPLPPHLPTSSPLSLSTTTTTTTGDRLPHRHREHALGGARHAHRAHQGRPRGDAAGAAAHHAKGKGKGRWICVFFVCVLIPPSRSCFTFDVSPQIQSEPEV